MKVTGPEKFRAAHDEAVQKSNENWVKVVEEKITAAFGSKDCRVTFGNPIPDDVIEAFEEAGWEVENVSDEDEYIYIFG